MALESIQFCHFFDQVNINHCKLFFFISWSNNASWFNPQKYRDPKIGHLLFKHLTRREKINMKFFCFFRRPVFMVFAISISRYSNVIWRRHKDFSQKKRLLNILEFFWGPSRWSYDANLADELKGRIPKIIIC
jgi:hypothetical protein